MSNLALLQKYAPYIWLHSEEKYFPVDVGSYLSAVIMVYPDIMNGQVVYMPVTTEVTADNIDSQTYTNRAGTTAVSSFGAGSDDTTQFYLPIQKTQIWVGTPLQDNNCVAPVYAAVVNGPLNSDGVAICTDLLYSFFYAYNGASMNDPGFFDTHQGDWEHVIVRLGMDGETVLGIYFQAHRASDEYSKWYFPPGTNSTVSEAVDTFNFYDDTNTRFLVYSSQYGHASYPAAGSYFYSSLRGTDVTDAGFGWDSTTYLAEMIPPGVSDDPTTWVNYSGLWGSEATPGSWGNPPSGPYAQGWFTPRTDGPVEYNTVTVSREAAEGQKSRVSANFNLNLPGSSVLWSITDLPDLADAGNFAFTVMEDVHHGNDKDILDVKDNTISSGKLNSHTDELYIGRLRYIDPATQKTYSGKDVFDYLNIDSFTIEIAVVTATS